MRKTLKSQSTVVVQYSNYFAYVQRFNIIIVDTFYIVGNLKIKIPLGISRWVIRCIPISYIKVPRIQMAKKGFPSCSQSKAASSKKSIALITKEAMLVAKMRKDVEIPQISNDEKVGWSLLLLGIVVQIRTRCNGLLAQIG